ncbi:RhuM family protein [Hallella bergensis]|uniref:RhuM family protein n=1 Tax=Hallella bergensis TaxID=242750 RepID=UPI002350F35A|nr:RhuM family protein [Hallella bergensis]
MQKLHIANSNKSLKYYNLDVIISVGYRVKSQQGTRFKFCVSPISTVCLNWKYKSAMTKKETSEAPVSNQSYLAHLMPNR